MSTIASILSPALRRRRQITLLLLMAAGCVSYIDRAALSVSNTAVMADMHMSYTQMGLLLSVFAWAYLAGQVPTGLLADRFDSRFLLGAGLVLWSCAQMAFGLMHGIAGLFLARIGLGLGETPLFLSGTRALVRWYQPRERGRPLGLFNGSAALGPALAPPLLLAIMALWGWRGMSVAIGAASLVLAFVWIRFYRDPADLDLSVAMRKALPRSDAPVPASITQSLRADLGHLLRQRSSWVLTAGYAGVIYLTWLYATWMPAWLQTSRHLTIGQAGMLSALPQFCGFAGSVLGGVVVDRLAARGVGLLNACRAPLVLAMLVAAIATTLTTLHTPLAVMVAFMAIALFAGGLAISCGWMLGTVIAAEHRVATLQAIQNTGGSLGGALAPAITGLLADRFGSFTPSLLTAGAIGLGTVAIYQIGLRPEDVATHASLPNGQPPSRLSGTTGCNKE
ncbi:MFS transporter [Gluconacetobacter asukensis]|uniref:MFS transporter n=1 Tax=Gluconacetobacter asukensis TaxID=1017181 RepID=A0A7W4IX97_9PROT|nr:MFS transporter [Gluconacetobacter asukensis]MBB2170573.1 MFS transporter [Gluconacetobacter asukensis]